MSLGASIKRRRAELGMSQADLSRAARINQRQLGRYEQDDNEPSVSIAARIARALTVSLDDLVTEDRQARRAAALERARKEFTGTYPPGYLQGLRDEWPD